MAVFFDAGGGSLGEHLSHPVGQLHHGIVVRGHSALTEHILRDVGHGGDPRPGLCRFDFGAGMGDGSAHGAQYHIGGLHGGGNGGGRLLPRDLTGGHGHQHGIRAQFLCRLIQCLADLKLFVVRHHQYRLPRFYIHAGRQYTGSDFYQIHNIPRFQDNSSIRTRVAKVRDKMTGFPEISWNLAFISALYPMQSITTRSTSISAAWRAARSSSSGLP